MNSSTTHPLGKRADLDQKPDQHTINALLFDNEQFIARRRTHLRSVESYLCSLSGGHVYFFFTLNEQRKKKRDPEDAEEDECGRNGEGDDVHVGGRIALL